MIVYKPLYYCKQLNTKFQLIFWNVISLDFLKTVQIQFSWYSIFKAVLENIFHLQYTEQSSIATKG